METGKRKSAPDANLLGDIAALADLTIEHFQAGRPDPERAEKLVAAKWMRRMADRLIEEAESATLTASDAARVRELASEADLDPGKVRDG